MEPRSLQWVGSPCGLHGSYVFYKALRFHGAGKPCRLLSVGDFFLVRCGPEEPLCVAELQLLWEDRKTRQLLSSSKLYFLPEDTPQGRSATHGEDEVMAVSEKVVVRLEDLVRWTVWDQCVWNRGMKALPLKMKISSADTSSTDSFSSYHDSALNCGLHFKDVLKEKAALGESVGQKQVLVLSYPRYCRYRSVVARLHEQPRSQLTNQVVLALGGIAVLSENTHILYCRDTFHHPTLLHNESICDEFAPNLKGRPRKKRPTNALCRYSLGQSQGLQVKGRCRTSLSFKEAKATARETTVKVTADKAGLSKLKGSSNCSNSVNHSGQTATLALPEERRRRGRGVQYRAEEQAFLVSLYKYMKERKTPIERIPYLGFKQINLWTMFQAAQNLGGYELITARRQWKNVYDELGGNPGSTSAATCTRRHYERLILPYERYIKGEENKPLPQFKPRTQEMNSSEGSSNGNCTPILKTEKNDALDTKDQDHSRVELMEQNSQLKLEPQICLTRLDSLQPHIRKRQSPTQDCQNDTEVQQMLHREGELKRKRRYSGCDNSCLTASPMTKNDKSKFPPATPKIFNHAPSAMDLWQHQQVPLQDQCHVGKPRNLQSPTIPEPPSEQAELPRTEDSSSGFTTPFDSSRVGKVIMSPLAKKKPPVQISNTGLPSQDYCHSNFGQHPPPICIIVEAAEQPAIATDSSVVALSRPSVIQHVQSFKERVQKDRERQIKVSTPPSCSHKHHFHYVPPSCSHSDSTLMSHQKAPQCQSAPAITPKFPQSSWTPQGLTSEHCSSFSHLRCWHWAAKKADGAVNAELVRGGSKQPPEQEATLLSDPGCLMGFLQSADDSKHPILSDQDKSSNPKTTVSDDQPTDLSLPKSSFTSHNHPYTSCPQTSSTSNQKSNPVLSQTELTAVKIPNKIGNISKRRQAATPSPKDVLSSSSSREIETSKGLDGSFVGESAEGAEGGAAASPFSLLSPVSHIYPNHPFSQVHNLCRDTLSIPVTMDQLHCSDSDLQKPHQYLKIQSADFVSPVVPTIAIHSSIIQKQLLAQAAASPIHVYQQTNGDVIHHRPSSVSVNPQPTFSQRQFNSVHPSTKQP